MTNRIRVLTTDGLKVLSLDDREASLVGHHWNAVRRFLEYGDDAPLAALEGQRVGHSEFDHMPGIPGGYELETDLDAIEWHAVRGEVSFESIYDDVV